VELQIVDRAIDSMSGRALKKTFSSPIADSAGSSRPRLTGNRRLVVSQALVSSTADGLHAISQALDEAVFPRVAMSLSTTPTPPSTQTTLRGAASNSGWWPRQRSFSAACGASDVSAPHSTTHPTCGEKHHRSSDPTLDYVHRG
jgi:hypothetical protein